MTVNQQTVDELKSAGHCFAAGAVAFAIGASRNYGCHFGMRSELAKDRAEFERGWNAAYGIKS